jgi:hypothetical protein
MKKPQEIEGKVVRRAPDDTGSASESTPARSEPVVIVHAVQVLVRVNDSVDPI